MNSSSFVAKRFKSIFKRYIIFLAMILVTFNGMIPASLPVQAVEKTGVEDLEQPNVSKDVDGEESKEIEKGTDYHYNVNVQLPENISGYETMTISDDLDKRLAVQKTAVLINGEVDDRFKAVVDSQKVSLVFKQEQLQELADKEIKLQITTQVKEDAITGNKIYNIANIIINGNFVTETNPAVATPVDTEEKHQAKPNASKEDASKEDGEKNVESNDNPPAKKSADASVNQVQATNGITINDVDSYGVQGLTLLQFDGTNPTTTPKASVPITGISARNLNGLALSLTENAFYASTLGTGNLYKIDADGKADFVTTLEGVAGNAVIYDGKYYYSYGSGGKSFLGSYDLTTGNKTSTEIKGFDNLAGDLGGDIVADGDGYLWFYRSNSVMQLDRETANILRSVSITNSDGVAIEWGIRGISFLPSGKMLLAAGDPNPKFYIIDPETKSTTYLGAMTGDLIFDLASAVTPKFEPNPPVLESNKTAKIQEKAEGNTDADHPEVGDTIRYTITTKNTIEDSLVKNLVITDTIPKGLIYVAGSLEVDGQKVTDAEDDDAGHVVEGKVTGTFGNVMDTDEHTVTFLVTVDKGQAGADIKNIATVGGDNTDDPDEPEEEVEIYPRDPKFESAKTAVNLDQDKEKFEVGDTVVYTIKARNTVSESIVKNFTITDKLMDGLEYVEGSLKTDPEVEATFENGTFTANFGEVKDTEWRTLTFHAKIQSGQSGKELKNIATVEGEDVPPTHPEVPIKVDPKDPKLESKKSAKLEEKAEGNEDAEHPEVGDTIRYTITTKNTIEDSLVKNLVINDTIPKGLTYVAGSLEVDGQKVSDAKDDDAGHAVDGKVTGTFGNVTDTDEHVVTFLVTVDKGQAGADIKNIATVGGDNTDVPDEPEEEVEIYPRDPKFESAKTAVNLDQDKEKFEVGDTVVYTIKARNTVSESIIKNFTITDKLMDGLEYVEGSLKTDPEVEATFENGTFTANFGEVKDTEWRTLTFHAKIQSGQSGKELKNIATVEGEEVPPTHPEVPIKVDPKDPKLESKKSAKLEEKAEGNKDADHPEVGDTIRYTITTKNTIEDSLVENLVITDTIPKGLIYVAGSLEVDGQKVTDAEDDDAGHAVDGKVTGTFGNVKDTDEHTVSFLVTVDKGQAGADIKNIATVGGDNTDDPDEPGEEVKIYPRDPKFESAKTAVNLDQDKEKFEVGDTVVYTIKARNTVSESIIKNFTITDKLMDGLEYVEGSLKADPEVDATFENGTFTANFGEVKDTEWRTLTFHAKIQSGQSGKELKNIATVEGEEVPPTHPEVPIKVDPKDPKLESDKTAVNAEEGKEKFEVGDTIVYTIQTRNTVSDSLVKNLTIEDTLPEGLEFVEGSLEVSHEGKGEVKDGKITATFGDVIDTEWRTVTFEAKIKSGQSGKKISNVANVGGDNIDEPDEPENETTVDPKDPKLESKKTAENAEKDKEKFEVGDTIVYTIQTRNTVSDSLVKNLAIEDTLPAGLEFVEGSLEVSHEGKGEFKDGKITATFGDVTDTEWRTVTFEAKIKSGQSDKKISNVANVGGDNIDEPDEPENETTVDPKDPQLESKKTAENAEKDKEKFEVGDTIVYTIQTRNTVSDSLVKNLAIEDTLPAGLEFVDGSLEVSHEGKGEFKDGKITATFGDVTDTEWRTVTFEAKIKSGQSGKEIENTAKVTGDNIDKPDEPTEKVTVDPKDPVLKSEKSAKLEAKAEGNKDKDHPEVGDTLLYTIKTQNTIEDSLVKNLVISDDIPEGLEYVEGSLKVDGESVTDAKDNDKGHAVDGSITGQFGDIKDTNWHTVEFLVSVKSGQAGKYIQNIAVVDGDNVGEPDKPEEEVQIYPRHSVFESEKSAENAEKDKEKFEVGDTIVYTIKSRNKVSDSLVENMTISDTLPEGLEYVADSLKVSHEGKGEFKDGKITAAFGDVKDTEWRTVTFEAKIKSGQSGKAIENIATVDGDNVEEPDKPGEKVTVDPKTPKLESKKTAENAEKGKEKYVVGDTIVYTIQARNTVSDSLVKNLSITDKLPEGLEYVADSLKVSHEGTGDVKEGKITATFGDVTDTEWRTVTFEAKIKSGQSGKAIENIATVGGDNVDEPDKPGKKVTVDPKTPKLESKKSAENAEKGKEKYEVGDTIVYTIQARNTVSDSLVKNMTVADTLPEGLEYVADSLKVSHEGKGEFKDGKITATLGDVTDTEWRTVTFEAKIKFGQSGKAIENIATVGGDNVDEPDKPGEKVTVDPKDPVLTSEKSAKLEAKAEGNKDKDHAEVGDTIRYSIKARNTEENSLVTNLVISDELPKGLEYVAGSLKVDGESVTDAKDKDKGYAADGRIAGQFGDIKDIDWHTVEFLVTVKSGQAGKDIKNVAVVEGDNIDTPDKPEEVVQVYPRNSVLESEKLAANLEKDKEKFEVGDTVVYTIKARNKESDSLVENLTIADKLPAGLEYVDGSLEVSHKGSGDFKDGTITATFGDVKDTEWRTVTFKAKLQSGQFGESIKNIAEVSGDNVPDPNHPEAKIEVEPKDPEPTPEEPKDPKDPTPTPEEPKEPKDPAPTPDQNDNPGVKTPPSDTAKGDGKKLPNTATNLFNYGLIGILAILAGGLLALRRKKSNNN